MKKGWGLFAGVLMIVFVMQGTCLAGLINYQRRLKKAQAAAGGAKGSASEERIAKWMVELPRVSSAVNRDLRKYDVNRDGVLQTAEIKIYLRDVIDGVVSKGGYTVDSEVLREYDKNKDGVINSYEVAEVRKDAF
ncbi:MAG: hypothetical protein WC552_04250 [Candidatus Omnitrophota bacterium]